MASWWQKTLLATVGLAGAAGGAYYLLTRRPLPKKRGTLRLHGVHEPIEIITDDYGVPHIYAQNEDDLFFAQGFVHAQDRLWQMDFNRRIGSGRISEIFGPIALEVDRFARRLGMHRSAQQEVTRLSPHVQRILDAYTRGVNAYITQNTHKLPIEFTLMAYKPDPWRPVDTIQWSKMMGWNLSGNWETELIRARLVAALGAERASRLEPGYDAHHPLIIPPGVAYQGINLGLLEQYEQLRELSGFGMLGGSNNWVVSGALTATGSPMLCNDPHLEQSAPSIWYECHLVAGDIDVTGASFPGAPGVVIGHNQHIAWGVTNAVSDVQDLYIEKFHPQHPTQYEFMGRWEQAQVLREAIKVRGKRKPVIEEVVVTRHGPILTKIARPSARKNNGSAQAKNGATDELPVALRWTGLEQCNILSSVQKLNRASNWEEFRDALRDWDVPPQNVVYGDKEGNIGYVMAGAIPIRAQGQALVPSPGWTGAHEWSGLIPFDELPQTYNPEQQFIATANNRVIDDSYPYYISNEWLNGYRAQRIRDLLTSKRDKREKLTTADMARIQADQYSLPATEIVPHILRVQPTGQLARAAQDFLRVWDFVLAPESVGASIYTTFLRKLERIFLGAVLGDDETLIGNFLGISTSVLSTLNGYASRLKPLLIRLMDEHDDSWFADSAIPNGPRSWAGAISAAFEAALEELREQFGSDVTRWQYGRMHRKTFNHPLGLIKPLKRFFSRGSYPNGGDFDTVNMGAMLPQKPQTVTVVPSYRQIVSLADLNASLSMHAPGQSGHPASKHYDDFIDLWRTVRHHPMLFDRDSIEEHAEATLHILPPL